ncbi:helix-turn-helix domain-containing protein [bacterium]|nr:helix-turn-helix domain-containing protein [bacterium]
MSSIPVTNHELQLVDSFVEQTGCNIFLTGKAGTGKTTFLKSLHERTDKRLIITAPTGVAAINAGGVTLHSFFQLPLGPFVPGSDGFERGDRRQFRFSKQKKDILKSLDLLVIDEISMVRADLLDAVDSVLRRYRRNNLPFGGVQLLMIGDLHQLPPVAKREEWALLRQHYDSVYFFSSKSLARSGFITIELKHIYRQTDESFINILNLLRDNQLDEASIAELNKRYVKDFAPKNDSGYITLTTHNLSAETINNNRLQGLSGKIHYFRAEISGEFHKHSYPAPEELQLKKGAQVMFLRNDNSAEKLYYNGRIGKVVSITADDIKVVCPGDEKVITVEPATWENIKYTLNNEKSEIEADIIGLFKQFPLKLAWAITIHKSQGLTFEKAIIDSEDAFVHGQTYVALSRCKTLNGVVLSSPISSRGIKKDQAIRDFDISTRQNPPSHEHLEKAKAGFQQELLLDCFDFKTLKNCLTNLVRLFQGHTGTVRITGTEDLKQTLGKANQDIFIVGEKFGHQLRRLFQNGNLPESDPQILERITKASGWFSDKFKEVFGDSIDKLRFETDNSILEVKINEASTQLKKEIAVKLEGIKSLENGFSPSDFLRKVSLARIGQTSQKNTNPQPLNVSESDTDHPELVSDLKKWRSQKAEDEEKAKHQILPQRALHQIVETLPLDISGLKKIKGLGKKTVQKYGKDIIAVVSGYREKHGIIAIEPSAPASRREKQGVLKEKISETKRISYELFNSGLTIDEIAEKRGLVKTTIEGHLSFFIEQSKLDINRLLSKEKQEMIKRKLRADDNKSLSTIREELGDTFSYGEIKMVLAFQNKVKRSKELEH